MNTFGLHHQLLLAFHYTNRAIVQATAESGLLPGQPKILEALCFQDGCSQKELALVCALDKSTITHLIKRLEAQGLIVRTSSESDRRSMKIYLTDEGKKAAEKVSRIAQTVDEQALSSLTMAEQDELLFLLNRMLDGLYDEENVD